ncbi:unnamed protein product [Cercospora beticola]|nr:unnamed protein product [Cercospora beticola]
MGTGIAASVLGIESVVGCFVGTNEGDVVASASWKVTGAEREPLGQRLHALLWNGNAVAGSALEVLQSYFARLAAGCAAKPLEIRCHHFAFSPAARAHPSHHHLFLLRRQYNTHHTRSSVSQHARRPHAQRCTALIRQRLVPLRRSIIGRPGSP